MPAKHTNLLLRRYRTLLINYRWLFCVTARALTSQLSQTIPLTGKTENCIEAGTKLKDLSQYFQATAAGDSNDQATAAFYNGEELCGSQGFWAIAQINGNNPDFESNVLEYSSSLELTVQMTQTV